jgi:hypothetical protein
MIYANTIFVNTSNTNRFFLGKYNIG